MKEDHYILGAGGPLGQCSRKLISNPARPLWKPHTSEPYNTTGCTSLSNRENWGLEYIIDECH